MWAQPVLLVLALSKSVTACVASCGTTSSTVPYHSSPKSPCSWTTSQPPSAPRSSAGTLHRIHFHFFFSFFSILHSSILENLGHHIPGYSCNRHKSPPVLQVCAVFLLYLCVQTAWLPCTVFGIFNMRPNVMHATAHRDYTNTVRESALRVDSESKIPCHSREWNRHQYCSQLFGLMLHHLSHPVPLLVAIVVFMPRLLDFSCQQKGSDV